MTKPRLTDVVEARQMVADVIEAEALIGAAQHRLWKLYPVHHDVVKKANRAVDVARLLRWKLEDEVERLATDKWV